jgi:hypothetical protein
VGPPDSASGHQRRGANPSEELLTVFCQTLAAIKLVVF